MSVGFKIRELRKSQHLSITDLTELTGLSSGLISLIERDKTIPTITVMLKIVKSLNVTMGYFFDEMDDSPTVVRKDERNSIVTSEKSRIYELLTPTTDKKIEFVLIRLNKCTGNKDKTVTHIGEECGFIIKGSVVVTIDNIDYVLHEGDSIYFNSSKAHIYQSYDEEESISIWAMTPPSW